jgi:transposase
MKKYEVILGVDISKLTLDISCADRHLHLKISNNSDGFNYLKKWCKVNKISLPTIFIVMEHTVGYEYRFIQFCESAAIDYYRIYPLEIKKS